MLKAKNKFVAIITCLLLTLVLAFGGVVMTTSVARAEDETASGITITMQDSYGDSWNEASIEVYKDGELLVGSATVSSGETAVWEIDYDETAIYVFVWCKGNYDNECSFTITVNGTEKFSADEEDCSNYTDRQWIFSTCEHSFAEGSLVCEKCNITCGNEFAHQFTAEKVCDVCGYECGVSAEHDWSNKDGVCGICALECEHNFDGLTCTLCNLTYAAIISDGEGAGDLYITIFEAIENAADGATVKLLSNLSVDSNVNLEDKTLVIDLNGYTWGSSTWLMYVQGASNVTITDTSEKKTGILYSTGGGTPTVILKDESTLTLAGGTIYHNVTNPISISNSGNPVEANFIMTGGKVQGGSISMQGNSMTLKGGVLEDTHIFYQKGDLNFSEYPNPAGIRVKLSSDHSALGTVSLPENYALLDKNGESAYTEWGEYTITHTAHEYDNACDSNCNICLQDAREPAAHEYDNACDGNCNICLQDTREPAAHEYDNACDGNCNICLQDTREPAEHDWSNLDGICTICEEVCTHTFEERTCTVCGYIYVVGVFADGESEGVFYSTIFQAFENAANGATVKLFTDISVDNWVEVKDKNLVIDLNGYTWTSSVWVMYVYGSADVTITDTSEEGTGVLVGTNASCCTILLYDNARLELVEGTLRNSTYPVMITDGGRSVEADFVMSGGKLEGHGLNAQGNSVTITGGVLELGRGILLLTGSLDLSQYPDVLGVQISVGSDLADIGTISLPEGYALMGEDGELVAGGEYTVKHVAHTGGAATCTTQAVCTVCDESYGELAAHEYDNACDGNCNVCKKDTREPAAHVDEDKNGECDVCTADVPVENNSSTESSVSETSDDDSSVPEISESSAPAISESTAPQTSEEEEDSGCSSMLDGISMAALAMVGLAIVVKKRKEN